MLPLKDKTILITRSANQAEDFINQLHNLGAKTITLPLIKNTPINQNELKVKSNQFDYDWLIFTSVNAVKFFFDVISADEVKAKIAVVGSKTAELIQEIGLKVDFTPSRFTAKHIANEIPVQPNETILIPRSILASSLLIEILEARKCKVVPIVIYNNNSVSYSKEELNKIFSRNIDYISFTSGSIVKSFIAANIELKNEKIVCIGPVTAKIAEKSNLKVFAIANPHTTGGMLKAILKN